MEPKSSRHTCGICTNPFDHETQRPKILACGHTICNHCISEISSSNLAQCPWCRGTLCVVAENLLALEPLENSAAALVSEKTLNSKEANAASKCQQHNLPFSAFCTDCEEAVCTECFASVDSSHYDTSTHRRIELQSAYSYVSNRADGLAQLFEEMSEELKRADMLEIGRIKALMDTAYQDTLKQVESYCEEAKNRIDVAMKDAKSVLLEKLQNYNSSFFQAEKEIEDFLKKAAVTRESLLDSKRAAAAMPLTEIKEATFLLIREVINAKVSASAIVERLRSVYNRVGDGHKNLHDLNQRTINVSLPRFNAFLSTPAEEELQINFFSDRYRIMGDTHKISSPFGFGPGIQRRSFRRH